MPSPEKSSASGSFRPILPDRARVLVAEDDLDMRCLIVEALCKAGYDVTAVADGGRLLVALARRIADGAGDGLPDLILSDVRMPVCNGIQIVEQIRAARLQVPIILMTAFGDDATRKRAGALGVVLFDKPFEVEDLRQAVRGLLLGMR